MTNSTFNPAGSGLFSDFEVFVKDLSPEDESVITGGGGDCYGGSKNKSKKKSKEKNNGCGCP